MQRPLLAAAIAPALAVVMITTARPAAAQITQGAPARADSVRPAPAANPADVATPDAILAALYDVISGPAGAKRNWDRFRSLFAPGARLIPTGAPAGQPARASMLSPDEYVERVGPQLERNGFFEAEIGRTTEQFGRIMHAFSAYDSRRTREDATPFARGINSIQLLNDGTRWWVVTIYWDSERADNPIPDRYLRKR